MVKLCKIKVINIIIGYTCKDGQWNGMLKQDTFVNCALSNMPLFGFFEIVKSCSMASLKK
jgi:hypothetical protein